MKKHKDIEYHINTVRGRFVTKDLAQATEKAFTIAVQTGDSTVPLYVVVRSVTGARIWAGRSGVEQYEENPDASVFDRFIITVERMK
jgi:hypothetical protein